MLAQDQTTTLFSMSNHRYVELFMNNDFMLLYFKATKLA